MLSPAKVHVFVVEIVDPRQVKQERPAIGIGPKRHDAPRGVLDGFGLGAALAEETGHDVESGVHVCHFGHCAGRLLSATGFFIFFLKNKLTKPDRE